MMEKSKLGISVGLLAAAVCLIGYYGGYVITGLVVGYILLKEENDWLKKLSVKVLAVMLAYSVLSTLINFIPSVLSLVYSLIQIFDETFYSYTVERIFNFLGSVLSLLRTILFLVMGFKALQGKDVKIAPLDNLLNKYMA